MKNTDFFKIGYGPKIAKVQAAKPFRGLRESFVREFAKTNAIKEELFKRFPVKYNISKMDKHLQKAYTDRAVKLTDEYNEAVDILSNSMYSYKDEEYINARDTLNRVESDFKEINELYEAIAIRKGNDYSNDVNYAKYQDNELIMNNKRIFDPEADNYLFKDSYFNDNNELIIKYNYKDKGYKDRPYSELQERHIYQNTYNKNKVQTNIDNTVKNGASAGESYEDIKDNVMEILDTYLKDPENERAEIKEEILSDDGYLEEYYSEFKGDKGIDMLSVSEKYDYETDIKQFKEYKSKQASENYTRLKTEMSKSKGFNFYYGYRDINQVNGQVEALKNLMKVKKATDIDLLNGKKLIYYPNLKMFSMKDANGQIIKELDKDGKQTNKQAYYSINDVVDDVFGPGLRNYTVKDIFGNFFDDSNIEGRSPILRNVVQETLKQ